MPIADLLSFPNPALHLTPASSKARTELLGAVPDCLFDGRRDLVAVGDLKVGPAAQVEVFRRAHPRAVTSSREVWVLDTESLLRYPGESVGIELHGRRAEMEDNVGGDYQLVYERQAEAEADLAWWHPAFGKVWALAQCGQGPVQALAKSILGGDQTALPILADTLEDQGAGPLSEMVRAMSSPQPGDHEGRLLFPSETPCPALLVTPGSKRSWETLKEEISFFLVAASRDLVTTGACIDEFHDFRKRRAPALKGWRKVWLLGDNDLMTRPWVDALRGRPLGDGVRLTSYVLYDNREEAVTELARWCAPAGNLWAVWQAGPVAARDEARAVLDGKETLDDLADLLAKHKARPLADALRTLGQPPGSAPRKRRR
jgi:hypothetical protein